MEMKELLAEEKHHHSKKSSSFKKPIAIGKKREKHLVAGSMSSIEEAAASDPECYSMSIRDHSNNCGTKRTQSSSIHSNNPKKRQHSLDTFNHWIPRISNDKLPVVQVKSKEFYIEEGNKLNFFDQFQPTNLRLHESPYVSNGEYEAFFYQKQHFNWSGVHTLFGPCILSILRTADDGGNFRTLVRTQEGEHRTFIHYPKKLPSSKSGIAKKLLYLWISQIKKDKVYGFLADIKWRRVKRGAQVFEEALKDHERKMIRNNFKVGVIYQKEGQKEEHELFGNEEMSEDLLEFLEFMGEKVRLKNFKGFAGGLDTTRDKTGSHSYFTQVENKQIMFHVAPLIPTLEENSRKVHIGNDIVTIVFNDGESPFYPEKIQSKFTHIFVVIQKVKRDVSRTCWRVSVAYKKGVWSVEPAIPGGSFFEKTPEFRLLLLAKIINSERSAYSSSKFAPSLKALQEDLLLSLYQCSISKKFLRKDDMDTQKTIRELDPSSMNTDETETQENDQMSFMECKLDTMDYPEERRKTIDDDDASLSFSSGSKECSPLRERDRICGQITRAMSSL